MQDTYFNFYQTTVHKREIWSIFDKNINPTIQPYLHMLECIHYNIYYYSNNVHKLVSIFNQINELICNDSSIYIINNFMCHA